MLNIDNINNVKLEEFIRKLNQFYASKNSIRSSNVNKIQKRAVLLKKWNEENSLNPVPDLESNGVLDDIIQDLKDPNYSFNDNYLNSLGEEFIKEKGLNVLYEDEKTISKFLELIRKTSQNQVFNELKNELSEEEFNLGFEIYNLETTVPKKLYNYFLKDPGIDNLPFDVEVTDQAYEISNLKMSYYRTIKSNEEFLEQLNQLGLNERLKFDHSSKIIKNYELSIEIRKQSLEIRDQIYTSFNKINNIIDLYYTSILDRNQFLNKIETINMLQV